MIATLRGTLTYLEPTYCIIECGGVGFQCYISGKALGSMSNIGEEVKLFTYMSVKEDAIDLYGFADMEELNCFKLITSVSGVGSKIGLAILTAFSPQQISLYIAGNDPKSLTAASGVGIKLAQRIILELKDKVTAIPGTDVDTISTVNSSTNINSKEAIAALVSLGYSQSEATHAVNKLSPDLPVDTLIKEALKLLARQV
ncbi:MAG: Holliday junction branch migration protein RuvA [Acutalibacteraceae bacterium]|nr:Holliday junction branch migration protein RuvA [Acutalibacteraceae bacterium]